MPCASGPPQSSSVCMLCGVESSFFISSGSFEHCIVAQLGEDTYCSTLHIVLSFIEEFFRDGARIEAAFRRYFYRASPEQEEDSYEIIVGHANVIRYFVCRCVCVCVCVCVRVRVQVDLLVHVV